MTRKVAPLKSKTNTLYVARARQSVTQWTGAGKGRESRVVTTDQTKKFFMTYFSNAILNTGESPKTHLSRCIC